MGLSMFAKFAQFLVALTMIICVVALLFQARDVRSFAVLGLFATWNIAPYAAMSVLIRTLRVGRSPYRAVLLCICLMCIYGTYGFIDLLILRPDPQAPIGLLVIPMLIWLGVLFLTLLTLNRRRKEA